MSRLFLNPLTPYWFFSLAMAAYWGWLGAMQVNPPDEVGVMIGLISPTLLLMWMERDAARHRRTPCFDFGWLSSFVWPVMIPLYCIRTRGWSGVLLVLGMTAAFLAPFFIWGYLTSSV